MVSLAEQLGAVSQEKQNRNEAISKTYSRRWESEHDHVNDEHWYHATDQHINYDLECDLPSLVAKCEHEYHNNPMVEGVVNTHTIDLLGETGPSLQVISDNPRYNSMLEEIFSEWWDSCTVDGLSGFDLMARYNENDWLRQISIAQILDMSHRLPGEEIIKTRLLDIAPRRLRQPWHTSDRDIINGVKVDQFDIPTHYFISQRDSVGYQFTDTPEPISADDVIVWFDQKQQGQTVGYPRLAAALNDIAELRAYDSEVMDAARAAANNSFLLETQAGAIEFLTGASPMPNGTTFSVPRRSMKTIPVGYSAKQMTANQPIAHYDMFRHEKLRNLGRGVHMPLMQILLDASDANFSSSRINLNVLYERGLNFLRGRWQRQWLIPLVKMIEREASLATFRRSGTNRFVLGRKPDKVSYQFGWEPLGNANPKDYAQAVQMLLAMRLTSPQKELAKNGHTIQELCDDWKEFNEKTASCGLDPIEFSVNGQNVPNKEEQPSEVS